MNKLDSLLMFGWEKLPAQPVGSGTTQILIHQYHGLCAVGKAEYGGKEKALELACEKAEELIKEKTKRDDELLSLRHKMSLIKELT